MTKYIDAEQLKERMQPLYENAKKRAHFAAETGTSSDCAKYEEAKSNYGHVLWLIDSLQQEQRGADLEKVYDAYCKVCGHYHHTTPAHICRQACDYFRDFKALLNAGKEE